MSEGKNLLSGMIKAVIIFRNGDDNGDDDDVFACLFVVFRTINARP